MSILAFQIPEKVVMEKAVPQWDVSDLGMGRTAWRGRLTVFQGRKRAEVTLRVGTKVPPCEFLWSKTTRRSRVF